jgi:hypothetical protein
LLFTTFNCGRSVVVLGGMGVGRDATPFDPANELLPIRAFALSGAASKLPATVTAPTIASQAKRKFMMISPENLVRLVDGYAADGAVFAASRITPATAV